MIYEKAKIEADLTSHAISVYAEELSAKPPCLLLIEVAPSPLAVENGLQAVRDFNRLNNQIGYYAHLQISNDLDEFDEWNIIYNGKCLYSPGA